MSWFNTAIDSTVAAFSPERALKRAYHRVKLDKIRSYSKYAAAQTNRLTGSWSPTTDNVNTIIAASSPAVRARVRQLVRDFPYFARAINTLEDYVVGPGIIYQARIKEPGGGLAKKLNQQIEDAFSFWAEQADFSGRQHFYEMMGLAKRQDVEAGEHLLIRRTSTDKKRFIPLAFQMYEPDWLDNTISDRGSHEGNAVTIDQGVEYRTDSGQIIAYHFTDPDGWGKSHRVSAVDVIHGFKILRPGQNRGISPFTPGVMLANDLDSMVTAELDTAKMASKYLAFVTTGDPASRQAGIVETDEDTSEKIEEMENAIIEYLRPDENIEIATNPKGGANFTGFTRFILTMLSITTNVPYELLTGDYQKLNYSIGRISRNDFAQFLKPQAVRHIRHFCLPCQRAFFDSAVLAGKLRLPGYAQNPFPFWKSDWQPPGMESIDPLKESKATNDQIKGGLRSPQEVARSRGRDLLEIYGEIKEAQDMAKEMGLVFNMETSTANDTNPAAVEKQE